MKSTNFSSAISFWQITWALSLGSIALLMLGLQPILLGELVSKHVITMEGVGIVAMGEIITLGLGVALGDALLPLSRYRTISIISTAFVFGLDACTSLATGDTQLAVLRAVAGLAEGFQLWVAVNVIVRSRNPDRITAIFIVLQTLFQSLIATILATWIVPTLGWQGGFYALAALALSAIPFTLGLPIKLRPLSQANEKQFRWTLTATIPLLIAFTQMAALGAIWAYLEPIGLARGLNAQDVQTIISGILLMQVIGGMAAIWLVRRLNVTLSLRSGAITLAIIATAIYFLPAGERVAFTLLCAIFGFAWQFLMPFHISLAFRVDDQGHVALLIPAAQLIGSAFGPLMASLVVTGDATQPIPIVSLCFALAMLGLTAFGRKRHFTPISAQEK